MREVDPWRLLAKAVLLFCLLNAAFAALHPPVGRLSIYNWLVRGRERMPADAGNSAETYNISPGDLDALFASHVISGVPKAADEFRVVLLGDSQTWGWAAPASESMAAQFNRMALTPCGRHIRVYNLAYPGTSVLKDLLIARKGLSYHPDLVLWMVTLQSFTVGSPTATWNQILADLDPMNSEAVLATQGLERYAYLVRGRTAFMDRTVIGQRARLARLVLLQLYGAVWAATGVDSAPRHAPAAADVSSDNRYEGISPPNLPLGQMSFGVLNVVRRMLGTTPLLVVNQPIYMATGKNSNVRYSREYPRWAYDAYRLVMSRLVIQQGIAYIDLHDAVPPADFTGSLHLTDKGEEKLADALAPRLEKAACP